MTAGIITGATSAADESIVDLTLQNHTGPIIRWEYSIDGGVNWTVAKTEANSDWTNARYNGFYITRNSRFRALINLGSYQNQYTSIFDVTWVPYSQANPITGVAGANFTKVQNVTVAGITNSSQVDPLTYDSKREVITYLDGRGSSLQQVIRNVAPSNKDVIHFNVTSASNVGTQYLPYVSNVQDGSYHSQALSEQTLFYSNGSFDKVADSQYPFSKTIVEKSPLGRVLEQGSLGQEWQPGTGHSKLSTYSTNDANDVRLFAPDGSSTSFYNENELAKSESIDQNGNKKQLFIDKSGRTVLVREQLDETIAGVNTTWLETYYVYTTIGNVRYIISPKGVQALKDAGWSFTAVLKDQFVFEFVYDAQGRVVEKKTPGQAPLYYVYDRLDRLILVQDGTLRPLNQWFYIKYDRAGRPVIQGIYTNSTSTTRIAVQQNVVDPLYSSPATKYYEDRGTTQHGYTNVSFPTTGTQVLAVNYYDGYDFDYNGTNEFSYTSQSIAGEGTQATAFGLPTGSKCLVLGTSTFLQAYVFYDQFGRLIQKRSNNHLSATIDNLLTNLYDFEGKIILAKNYHNAGSGRVTTVINKYEYDPNGRPLRVFQNNNASPSDQLVVEHEYNALGQLVDKKLHKTGAMFLQSIDYRYSISGWISSINNAQLSSANNDDADVSQGDVFGMEFLYNTSGTMANTPRFDGTISAVMWKGPAASVGNLVDQKSYKYTYDKSGKLKAATFQMNNGTAWAKEQNAQNENLTYDHNGNILSLQRHGRQHQFSGMTASYTSVAIDNLTYTYSPIYGNRLEKVEDATSNPAGFTNGANTSSEYTYDIVGNVTADQNKGISSVIYNVLGKVSSVVYSDGRKVDYTYDATGAKLVVKNWNGTTLLSTTDYVGSFVYEGGTLKFFASPEGRVVNNSGTLEYQYSISDQQGNSRVILSSVTPAPVAPVVTFEGDAGDGSAQYNNINASYVVSFGSANHTSGGSKVIRMNQNYKIGPSKSVKVYPGDKVNMEAWAYHESSSGYGSSGTTASSLISMVSAAFGGVSGGAGESGMIYNGVSSAYTSFATPAAQDNRPAAYINYILFDKDYKLLDMGYSQVALTTFTKQLISIPQLNISEPGYVFVYLSYEQNSNNYVYFDDLKVIHTKTNVIQYNEYYPFGLSASTSWLRENNSNNFLYNESSELNRTTGWYDLPFRNYDAALGRFMQVDVLALRFPSLSMYNYALNNPVSYNDPTGMTVPAAMPTNWELVDLQRAWQGMSSFGSGTWDSYGNAATSGKVSDWEYEALLEIARQGSIAAMRQLGMVAATITSREGINKIFKDIQKRISRFANQYVSAIKLENDVYYQYDLFQDAAGTIYSYKRNKVTKVGKAFLLLETGQDEGQQGGGAQFSDSNDLVAYGMVGSNTVNNMTAAAFSITDLHNATNLYRLSPQQVSIVAKVSKGTVGIGGALTAAGAYYEYRTHQFNTHTVADIVVGTTVTIVGGAAIVLSAPVTGTVAAVVGLGYGIASFAGGSAWLDEITDNWGRDLVYDE
jgi:RHS repeat-associated protein